MKRARELRCILGQVIDLLYKPDLGRTSLTHFEALQKACQRGQLQNMWSGMICAGPVAAACFKTIS